MSLLWGCPHPGGPNLGPVLLWSLLAGLLWSLAMRCWAQIGPLARSYLLVCVQLTLGCNTTGLLARFRQEREDGDEGEKERGREQAGVSDFQVFILPQEAPRPRLPSGLDTHFLGCSVCPSGPAAGDVLAGPLG